MQTVKMKPQKTITLKQWLATNIAKGLRADKSVAIKMLGKSHVYRGRTSNSRQVMSRRFGGKEGSDFVLKLIKLGWETAGSKLWIHNN